MQLLQSLKKFCRWGSEPPYWTKKGIRESKNSLYDFLLPGRVGVIQVSWKKLEYMS